VVAGIHDAEEEADNGDREMGHVAGAKVGWQKWKEAYGEVRVDG
jgi:hypothetical protein